MQHGMVDMVIVGSDRTTYTGDVANKIGTYLKALAAKDNNIPFYVALPSSTFDWEIRDGIKEIPIEERGSEEVKYIQGLCDDKKIRTVLLTPKNSKAANYGFDVTPARLITGLITERGICEANEKSILNLFPRYNEKNEEGYIKFNCSWIIKKTLPAKLLLQINEWRNKLYNLGLIGAYNNGIGFGNISIRHNNSSFIISGSATGNLNTLNESHYTLVSEYSLRNNALTCKGPIKASSESLTHAAIYECSPESNSVIHVHNFSLWKELLNKIPTTKKEVEYGTPEMANEIKRLFSEGTVNTKKIIAMHGHEEGILCFGKNLNEAGEVLLKYFTSFINK